MGKRKSFKLFAILFIAAFAFACVFATACEGIFGSGSGSSGSKDENQEEPKSDDTEESDVYIYLESETVSVSGTGTARAYVKVTEEIDSEEENSDGILLLDETQDENLEEKTGENDDPENDTQGNDDFEGNDFSDDYNPEDDETESEEPENTVVTRWELYTGSCSWGTSDSSVASVRSNGDGTATIVGVSEGTAEILLTLKDGSGRTGSATVTVVDDTVSIYTDPEPVTVGGIATAYAEIEYEEGGEVYSGKYRWSSSDSDVLEVNGNGDNSAEIKGISEGTATITVTLTDGRKGSLTVNVGPEVESVKIELSAETVTEGFEITATAIVSLDKDGAEYEGSYEWTVEDESVLTVEGNEDNTATVTGISAGMTKITVTLDDGESAEAYVTVVEKEPEVTGVEITFGGRQIQTGDEVTVTATVTMDIDGAKYEGGFAWDIKSQTPESGDGDVISYIDNGDGTITVTAVSEGTAQVAVTLDGGEYAEAEISVFAKAPRPSDAVLTVSDGGRVEVEGYILAGDEVTISVSVTMDTEGLEYDGGYAWGVAQNPENAGETVVTYTENDDGTITLIGTADGTATVYVTLSDGSVWETEITVVVPRVEEITLSADTEKILVGDELTIGVSVTMYPGEVEYEGGYKWSVNPDSDDDEQKIVSYTENSDGTITVTGVSEGTAVVTVTLDDGSEKSIEITVTVPKVVSVDITLSSNEGILTTDTVKILDEFTATAAVTMDIEGKEYEGNLEWSAEDPEILEVTTDEYGIVTVKAIGAGTGYLIAKTDDGKEWRLELFVLPAEIVGVTVTVTDENGDAASVEIGSTVTMTAHVEMDVEGAEYTGSYVWGNQSSGVISISPNGSQVTVQGVSEGEGSVMLRLDDGSRWFTDITVTAPDEAYPVYAWFGTYDESTVDGAIVDEILLDAYATTIEAPSLYVVMSVKEKNGSDENVTTKSVLVSMSYSDEKGYTATGDDAEYTSKWTWKSSDPDVADVDEKTGKITIGETGWATITADLGYGMTASFTIGKKAIVTGTDRMIGTWTDTVIVSLFGMLDIWADVDITITGGAEATPKNGNTELFSLYIYNITTGTGLDDLLKEYGFDLSEMNMTLFDQLPWYKIGDTYYVDVQDNAGTSYTVPVTLETIDGWDYICLTFDASMMFWMGSYGWWEIEVNIVDQKVARDRGHMHEYGEAAWVWTPDGNGGYTVTVTWKCVSDDCDKEDEYKVWTVEAVVTSEVTIAATCEEDGLLTYTATYEIYGNAYINTRTEVIPATGHSYPNLSTDSSALEWDWDNAVLSADGTEGTVTVTLTCPSCGSVLTYTATFTVTVDTPATCTAEGSATYYGTVTISDDYNNGTFKDTHSGVVLEMIPHTFPENSAENVEAGYIVWEWDSRDHGQQQVHLIVYCSACYGETPHALIDTYVAYTETADAGGETKTLSATYTYNEYSYSSSISVAIGKAEVDSADGFLLALDENDTGDLQITLMADIEDTDGSLLDALNTALEKTNEPRQITVNLNGYTLTLKGNVSLAVGEGNALEISGLGGENTTSGTLKLEQSLDAGAGNITVAKGSSLIITGAVVEATASAIIVQGDATSVNISESEIVAGGTYGIATTFAGSNGVTVIVENTKIYAVSEDNLMSTAVLIDVPSTVTITGGEIEGNYQGLVVRAGSVTVIETKISITGKYTAETTNGGENFYTDGYTTEETWTNATPYAAVVIGNNTGSSGYAVTVVFDGVEISTGNAANAWAVYTYSSGAECGVDFTVTNKSSNGNAFTFVPSGTGTTVTDGTGPVYVGVRGDGSVAVNEVKFVYSEAGTSVEVNTATGLVNALKMTGTYEVTLTGDITDSDGTAAKAFTNALSGTSASVTINLGSYTLDISASAEDITVGEGSVLKIAGGTLVMSAGISVGGNATLEMSEVSVVSDGTAVTAGGTGSVVTIENSKITAETGIAINAGAVLTVNGSTINGINQGLVVRGGTATVSDTKITVAADNSSDAYANESGTPKAAWTDDGVPNAAVVLGNYGEGEAYKGTTTASFTNVTLAVADEASDGTYIGLYVYSQSSDCDVDITINDSCNFTFKWLGLYDTDGGLKVYSGTGDTGKITLNGDDVVAPYIVSVVLDNDEFSYSIEGMSEEKVGGFVLSAIVTMSDGSKYDGEYTWSYEVEGGGTYTDYITSSNSGEAITITGVAAGTVTVTVTVTDYIGEHTSEGCVITLYNDPLVGTWVATNVDVTISLAGLLNLTMTVDAVMVANDYGIKFSFVPTYIEDGSILGLISMEELLEMLNMSVGQSLTLFNNQEWNLTDDGRYKVVGTYESIEFPIYAYITDDDRICVSFDGDLFGLADIILEGYGDRYNGETATMMNIALSTYGDTIDVEKGDTKTYTITGTKTDGTLVTSGFTATSGDTSIVTVSVSGRTLTMNVVGAGQTTIKITCDGYERTYNIVATGVSSVTITGDDGMTTDTPNNKITIEYVYGGKGTLTANVSMLPEGYSYDGEYSWSSSDESVVTVVTDSTDGFFGIGKSIVNTATLTIVSYGTATITVTLDDGSQWTCIVEVLVPDDPDVVGVEFEGDNLIIETDISEGTLTGVPTFVVSFFGGSTKTQAQYSGDVSWSSSDTSVAIVDENGNVTIVGAGVTIITVTIDGYSASYAVVVGATDIEEDDAIIDSWDADVSFSAKISSTRTYTVTGDAEMDITDEGDVTFTLHLTNANRNNSDTAIDVTIVIWSADKLYKIGDTYYIVSANEIVPFMLDSDGNIRIEFTATLSFAISSYSFDGDVEFDLTFSTTSQIPVGVEFEGTEIFTTVETENTLSGAPEFIVDMMNGTQVAQRNYNGVVTWSSSDDSVATIGADGEITLVGAGVTTITVTVDGFSASYILVVGYVEMTEKDTIIDTWETEETFSAKVSGSSIFSSSKTYTVSADIQIEVLAEDGLTLTVGLTQAVESGDETELAETYTIWNNAKLYKAGDSYYIIDTDTGTITEITIDINDKLHISFSVAVDITEIGYSGTQSFDLAINRANAVTAESISFGDTEIFTTAQTSGTLTDAPTFTLGMDDGSTRNQSEYTGYVIWESSDETVATVDEEGQVSLLKAGVTFITATVNEHSATYVLIVGYEEMTETDSVYGDWSEDVTFTLTNTTTKKDYEVAATVSAKVDENGKFSLTIYLDKVTSSSYSIKSYEYVWTDVQLYKTSDGKYYIIDTESEEITSLEIVDNKLCIEFTYYISCTVAFLTTGKADVTFSLEMEKSDGTSADDGT